MHLYTAYHLNIASCIECPMMRTAHFEPETADIVVRMDTLPHQLENAAVVRPYFQAKPQQALVKLAQSESRLLVKDGREIIFDAPDLEPECLAAFVISLGLALALLQRNHLIIHGNTLNAMGKNIIICGQSGAGKSTTTTALLQAGAKLVADDISPIRFDASNQPWVSPGVPFSKLWPESFELLDLHDIHHAALTPSNAKRYIPLDDTTALQTDQAIDAIFLLTKSEQIDTVGSQALAATDALLTIRYNSYGYRFLKGLNQLARHFDQATRLANSTPFFQIQRPTNGNSVNDVLHAIRTQLETLAIPVLHKHLTAYLR